MKKLFLSNTYLIVIIQLNIGGYFAQDFCSYLPCRPPSECENVAGRFVCHCPPSVKGDKCERRLMDGDNLCLSNPCWNGGICRGTATEWSCECPAGYSGRNCRTIEATPCTVDNPCKNGASCQNINTNGQMRPICYCQGPWTGATCDTQISLCSQPNPCYNGGTCFDNACNCPKNFTGLQCETYNPLSTDKIIKVKNKGWFIVNLKLKYQDQVIDHARLVKVPVEQSSLLFFGSTGEFRVPAQVNYDSSLGVRLTADAILGPQILSEKVTSDPECYHVWGTIFSAAWIRVECW